MANFRGMFYGYRGFVFPIVGRVELPFWELEGKIPTRNLTYTGNAADAYPAMIQFPNLEQSEVLWVQTWDEPLTFKLSSDGVAYEDEEEVAPDKNFGSWFHRASAKGMAIKNKTPLSVARYQVVVFFA